MIEKNVTVKKATEKKPGKRKSDIQINVRIPIDLYDWTELQRDKTDRSKLVRLGLELLQYIDYELLEKLASNDGLKTYALIEIACLHFSTLSASERVEIAGRLLPKWVGLRSAQKGNNK